MMDMAGSIKRHINKQLQEVHLQGVEFSHAIVEKEMDESTKTRQLMLSSPSSWVLQFIWALNIFLHPLDDITKVIPSFVGVPDLARFQVFLNEVLTPAFFKEPSKDVWESAVAGDRFLEGLVSELVLLVKSAANPRDGMISEDKNQAYTDRFVSLLFSYLGFNNPFTSKVVLASNVPFTVQLGAVSYKGSVEFGITLSKYFTNPHGPVFVFMEDKRLRSSSSVENIIGQRVAEALAFALKSRKPGESEDYVIFGICVRHRFFTFWHAIFSAEYLARVSTEPAKLEGLYALVKCYPASNYGLDICDPKDRHKILTGILTIAKYVEQEYE